MKNSKTLSRNKEFVSMKKGEQLRKKNDSLT